jgi:hypothetical protein
MNLSGEFLGHNQIHLLLIMHFSAQMPVSASHHYKHAHMFYLLAIFPSLLKNPTKVVRKYSGLQGNVQAVPQQVFLLLPEEQRL